MDHPGPVLAFYAGLLALCVGALLGWVPVRLTPAVPSSLIGVATEVMGMPAELVEERVSTPVERLLSEVPGVRAVRSASMPGMSLVTLEFPYRYDMRQAEADVGAAVQALPSVNWPSRGPRITRQDPLDLPVVRLAVRAPTLDPGELQDLLDTTLTARLRRVPGVAAVYTFGGTQRDLDVMVDREALQRFGLTLSDVRGALETATRPQAGGALKDLATNAHLIRVPSQSLEARALEGLVVGRRNDGRPLWLRDVASVAAAAGRDAPRYRYNGREAVEVNVRQAPDASSPRTLAGVRAAMDELVGQNPALEYEVAYDNAHFVEIVSRNVWFELGLAVLLTGLVVYLFLGDARGTLITLATVPTSLAAAVILFVPLGLSFNSSTLVGLLLAIGRLVDDTIIDLHAVQRHRALAKDARTAAIDGCSEVRRAVIAATVVICLAMLPLTFAGGLVQDMFTGLVWPFLLALLASLGVALTLTPLLASRVYAGVPVPPPRGRLEQAYRGWLAWALDNRGLVLTGIFSLGWLAWMILPLIGSEMMPLADTGQLYGVVEMRPGTSTAETSRAAAALEEILRRQPEVQRISTEIGAARGVGLSSGYAAAGSGSATLMITLTDRDQRKRSLWEIADEVWQEGQRTIPRLRRLSLKEMGSDVMATAMAPIEVVIHGPDLARLAWMADRTLALGQGIPGLAQPATAWSLQEDAWTLRVDEQAAARLGLSQAAVAEQAYLAMEGQPLALGAGRSLMLSYRDTQRSTARHFADITIVGTLGERVPLGRLATLVPDPAPGMIEHDNLRRSTSVMGSYRPGGPGSMALGMELLMRSRMHLPYPAGYDIEQRGDMTQMMDSFRRLLTGLAIALGLMYLALAAQFGSATLPLVIMMAIPLELPGVFAALLLSQQTFSTVSLLGLVVLNGMDVTASILLLDAVVARRAGGAGTREALLEGAPPRLRPVLMTVAVTLAVMSPLAFFPRTGLDAYAPLAMVIVGGLSMSTILTLGVVPLIYSRLAGDNSQKATGC